MAIVSLLIYIYLKKISTGFTIENIITKIQKTRKTV